MRIAILGTRGIPANYGGFETFAEQLSTRLVEREHQVTVYGRRHYVMVPDRRYRGVELVVLPTIKQKYLETLVHGLLSAIHAAMRRYDVIVVCNAANVLAAGILRLAGKKVVLNVDGIERQRRKWNWLGRIYYRMAEWLATKLPHEIVTDANVIQEYYRIRYGRDSKMIAYGAEVGRRSDPGSLKEFDLVPDQYFLYVSRLEPENNADLVIETFERVPTTKSLVIVGDAPYAKKYIRRLRSTRDPRIRFTGAIYGDGYRTLQQHAFAYIHATEVGGTHPALIEAMGFGNCVLVMETPENREVVADVGLYFRDAESLKEVIEQTLADPDLVIANRERAMSHIESTYDWEAVTDQYESLFADLTALPLPNRRKRSFGGSAS